MKARYRVWDMQKMYYPNDNEYLLDQEGDVCELDIWSDKVLEYVENAIIMQSIGRKDKNGEELYHHDIIELDGGRRCEIVWLSGIYHNGWDLRAINGKGSPPGDDVWDASKMLLIGNIYQNPALLES